MDEKQVAEGENREKLCLRLGDAAIAGLKIPELALGYPERMLDPRYRNDRVVVLVDGMRRYTFRMKPKNLTVPPPAR